MARPAFEQFAGSILGLALGDALGAVVEARPPEEARSYVELELQAGRAGERGRGRHPFGQVTDDTQLARELLLSVVECRGFDPAHFAERFMGFVTAGRLIGSGPASRAAARALADGATWQESGLPAPYAGNGAAMRAGPLGLLFGHDLDLLSRVVTDQSRVTHQDPRAGAGALAIAVATACAARGEPVVPGSFLEEVSRPVQALDAGVAGAIRAIDAWVHLEPDAAADHLLRHRLEPEAREDWVGISSFVTSSVCWSLYAFLRHPDAWWEAVCTGIRVGGDTDTLGAMTGAIAGARLGSTALPAPLVGRLHDGTHWRAGDLEELAARCHRLRQEWA